VTVRDVGDRVNIQYLSYNASGVLTNATVALAVTDPAGAVTNPSITNTSTGVYDAAFTVNAAGLWSWVWTVSGNVVDVAYGYVTAASPAPATYASVSEVKSYLNITSTDIDAELTDALNTASRDIDKITGRKFWPDTTASARLYYPAPDQWGRTWVDDFWSTTGLVVEVGDGTFTTIASTGYELHPLNGVVDGESGWPYSKIRLINTAWPSCPSQASLRVTAKWGWSAAPAPVKTACIILAVEATKLAREAPFGVAGFGVDGVVRIRTNPRVADMLKPYMRHPVLMA
jgi:hypothetical protein